MQRFKNIHEGKRIWVCGPGPSLMDIIPEQIPSDDIIMACNIATKHFESFDYACFTDESANYYDYHLNLVNKNCKVILFNPAIEKIKDETYYIEKEHAYKFDKESNQCVFGTDIVHCTVNLAWMMGAREIILAGVDLRYVAPGQKYPIQDIPIHYTPEGILEANKESRVDNNTMFDGHLGASLNYWETIAAHNKLNIFDMAVDGNLKIYPKKSFKDIINGN